MRPQLSAAGPTNRPQSKVKTTTTIIIKFKLWLVAGCEAKAATDFGTHPLSKVRM